MQFSRCAVALLTLAVLPSLAEADEKYSLVYKFQPNEKVRWEVIHRATVTSTIQGTTQTAQTLSESVKVWQVDEIAPSGEAAFTHWVESVKMINKLPNRAEVQYNSQTDSLPPNGYEDAARAVGVPLTEVRINAHGKVLQRKQKHIQQASAEETPIALLLPAEPVAIGDSWGEPQEIVVQLPDSRSQKVTTRQRFELKEVKDNIATIAIDHQVLSPVRDPAIESQLIQRLYKGEAKFDMTQGRIVSQKLSIDERVIGFSGPASSMHYLMGFEERLLGPHEKLAKQPPRPAGPVPPPTTK